MKRLTALLLCVLLIAALALPAGAQAQKLLYSGTVVTGDHVYLVGVPMVGGSVSVTANGQTIPSKAVSVAGAQLGVTYYCVVSVTSSLSINQREQQLQGVRALSEAMSTSDSMVLVTMGRSVNFGEKLTDKESRTAAINALGAGTVFGTNLYEGIDTILSTIESEAEGPSCVVVFSDGLDNSDVVKVTEEQVGRRLQNSSLCVNFVALLTPPVNSYSRNAAERLQRFADLSQGGACWMPLDMNINDPQKAVSEAMNTLVTSVSGWTAIELEAADLPRENKTLELNVTWTGSDNTVTDIASVDTTLLPAVAPLPTETQPPLVLATQPTETAAATIPTASSPAVTEPIPAYQEQSDQHQLYYIIIGSAAAMVLIAVAIVIVATRKTTGSAGEYDDYDEDVPEAAGAPSSKSGNAGNGDDQLMAQIDEIRMLPPRRKDTAGEQIRIDLQLSELKPISQNQAAEAPQVEFDIEPQKESRRRAKHKEQPIDPGREEIPIPSCMVQLIPEGDPDGEVDVTIPVNGSRTLGRNQKSDVILNGEDSALSGLHFELQWDGRVLYLADRGSTNGTALSGVPQRPGHWTRVESGSTVQAGSVRYKVKIVL